MMDLQHIHQGNRGTDLFNSSPAATVLAIKRTAPVCTELFGPEPLFPTIDAFF
jgi:hypothetical protein